MGHVLACFKDTLLTTITKLVRNPDHDIHDRTKAHLQYFPWAQSKEIIAKHIVSPDAKFHPMVRGLLAWDHWRKHNPTVTGSDVPKSFHDYFIDTLMKTGLEKSTFTDVNHPASGFIAAHYLYQYPSPWRDFAIDLMIKNPTTHLTDEDPELVVCKSANMCAGVLSYKPI